MPSGSSPSGASRQGLKEQAQAHYGAVVRLDPRREAAWKKLGYKKSGDRWVKPEQLAAEKPEAEQQKLANKRWKPILEKYREGLDRARSPPGEPRPSRRWRR